MTVEGAAGLRDTQFPDGLIVVSNHTGAVDPLLIQSACRFHIRWMMASAMMGRTLDWVWRMLRIIPIERDGRDSGPTREAIRHVKAGGVLGIFPEGRIVVPPGEVRPFHAGVGLIIARTKAPVLLVWVSGTPNTNKMAASLLGSSRAKVRFMEHVEFPPKANAETITRALREAMAEVSGWPINDDPLPPPPSNGNGDPFA
jgi:1-acyl-sn-glycerol-3-phosphate acyltransferase